MINHFQQSNSLFTRRLSSHRPLITRPSSKLLKSREAQEVSNVAHESFTNYNTQTARVNNIYCGTSKSVKPFTDELSRSKVPDSFEKVLMHDKCESKGSLSRKSSRSDFQVYLSKIALEEQARKNSLHKIIVEKQNMDENYSLRNIMKVKCKNSNPKYEIDTSNFKKAKLSNYSENSTPKKDLKNNVLVLPRRYNNNLFKAPPLISSEKYSRRIKLRQNFIEKTKEILNESDRKLLDCFEKGRINILRNSDWFSDNGSQKRLYLMIMELEENWLKPHIDSQIEFLAKERQRIESEIEKVTKENMLYEVYLLIDWIANVISLSLIIFLKKKTHNLRYKFILC